MNIDARVHAWEHVQRLKRIAAALRRRRERVGGRMEKLVEKYPHGHRLYARVPAGHILELWIVRMYVDRPTYTTTCSPDQNSEVTPDGQELWQLDRYNFLTLNRRATLVRDAVLNWLKEEGLDDGIGAER